MIKGIGVDIVDVKRIQKSIKNRRFLKKIFTDEEIKYCLSKKKPAQHFAVRFASKEAVWKAIKYKKVSHKDIGIKNSPDGKPLVYIKNKLMKNIHISLSHTDVYAVAVCIVT